MASATSPMEPWRSLQLGEFSLPLYNHLKHNGLLREPDQYYGMTECVGCKEGKMVPLLRSPVSIFGMTVGYREDEGDLKEYLVKCEPRFEREIGERLDELIGKLLKYLKRPSFVASEMVDVSIEPLEDCNEELRLLMSRRPLMAVSPLWLQSHGLFDQLSRLGIKCGTRTESLFTTISGAIYDNYRVCMFGDARWRTVDLETRELPYQHKGTVCEITTSMGPSSGMVRTLVPDTSIREITPSFIYCLSLLRDSLRNITCGCKDYLWRIHCMCRVYRVCYHKVHVLITHMVAFSQSIDNITLVAAPEVQSMWLILSPGVIMKKCRGGSWCDSWNITGTFLSSFMWVDEQNRAQDLFSELLLQIPNIERVPISRASLSVNFQIQAICGPYQSFYNKVTPLFDTDERVHVSDRTRELRRKGVKFMAPGTIARVLIADLPECYEDGIVVSESFASRIVFEVRETISVRGRHKLREGSRITTNNCIDWIYIDPGEVISLRPHHSRGDETLVETIRVERMVEGYKICTINGNKGVVTIKDDVDMPTDEKGKPFEIVFGSTTNIKRGGVGEVMEMNLLDDLSDDSISRCRSTRIFIRGRVLTRVGRGNKSSEPVMGNYGNLCVMFNVNTPSARISCSRRYPGDDVRLVNRDIPSVGEMETLQIHGLGFNSVISDFGMRSGQIWVKVCGVCRSLICCICETEGPKVKVLSTRRSFMFAKLLYCRFGLLVKVNLE